MESRSRRSRYKRPRVVTASHLLTELKLAWTRDVSIADDLDRPHAPQTKRTHDPPPSTRRRPASAAVRPLQSMVSRSAEAPQQTSPPDTAEHRAAAGQHDRGGATAQPDRMVRCLHSVHDTQYMSAGRARRLHIDLTTSHYTCKTAQSPAA